MKTYAGKFSSSGKKIAIAVSRFNEFITRRLLDGALDQLKRHGMKEEDIEIAWVPGAFELPVACLAFAESGKYAAVISLGCVIRGDTDHFEHVCNAAAKGIEDVAVKTGVPVVFGMLTCENLEQAIHRAGAKMGNKGGEAAVTALEMADLIQSMKGK